MSRQVLVASALTAVLSGFLFLVFEITTFKAFVRDQLQRRAEMTSRQVTAAIDFGDFEGAAAIMGRPPSGSMVKSIVLCMGSKAAGFDQRSFR